MNLDVILGILLPFAGTTLGAAMVFFMRKEMNEKLQKGLLGFASGVMIAASVWSLLIPAIEMAEEGGQIAWIPAAAGFLLGIGFLLLLDTVTPHQHFQESEPEGIQASLRKTTMLMLAVTLHNIPEGMAVGVTFAGVLSDNVLITMTGAFVLSAGIAIQNFPEGAIISMPLRAQGITKLRAFVYGTLSGIVEPIAAFLTIWLTGLVVPLLPYFLSFAAGGPGALFWMVVAAFFGMATKYAEGLLAIKYRTIDKEGHVLGGPFYYIENGMGKNWRWLAKIFAFFGAGVGLFGIGTFTQVNSIASAVKNFFDPNTENAVQMFGNTYSWATVITCIILTVCVGLVVIGGLKRIAKVSEIVVPFMAVLYVVFVLIIMITHITEIPVAIVTIVKSAFTGSALAGGAMGTMVMAMQKGIARGMKRVLVVRRSRQQLQ